MSGQPENILAIKLCASLAFKSETNLKNKTRSNANNLKIEINDKGDDDQFRGIQNRESKQRKRIRRRISQCSLILV